MNQVKRSPVGFILVIIVAILALALSIWAGKSPFGWFFPAANAQTVPPALVTLPKPVTWQDRDTYTMALDQTHELHWSDNNTSVVPDHIQIWRYRVEGGGRTLYLDLARSGWLADGFPNGYKLTGISIPKAGHWIYEAALCQGTNCSITVTTSCSTGTTGCAGAVGSVPRGWWIYAYLPAPGGVGVN